MDPPRFSDGGQPDSYTSSLLPGSGQQSSPMSDFTSEIDPFLTLPPTVQEPQQSLPETGSLRQVPVVRPQSQQQQQPCASNHILGQNSNTSASMPSSSSTAETIVPTNAHNLGTHPNITSTTNNTSQQKHPQHPLKHQQMWHTPPSGVDEQDHSAYDSSPPTCGSGTSNSNFSPVSVTGTWPSPATSFHQNAERPAKGIWEGGGGQGDLGGISTPASVNGGGSAAASEISAQYDAGYQVNSPAFHINGSEWHCEPLGTFPDADINASMDAAFHGLEDNNMSAVSCPASPAVMEMTSTSAAYMMRPANNMGSSPASIFDVDMTSSRASEPPMHDANMGYSHAAAEQQTPYAQLIYKALMEAPEQSMCLQEIYKWFQTNTKKCKPGQKGWMNSIRHNLSMNAGFTKRDRKRAAESIPPTASAAEAEETQSNGEPKRSTEWTLTDDAIANGIQSTTRYRNKKSEPRDRLDRDPRDGGLLRTSHHQSPMYLSPSHQHQHPAQRQQGLSTNRGSSPFNPQFQGTRAGVTKPYRRGAQGMRTGPTSAASGGFLGRTPSPAAPVPYFHSQQQKNQHDALMAHVMAAAAEQTHHVKMDPMDRMGPMETMSPSGGMPARVDGYDYAIMMGSINHHHAHPHAAHPHQQAHMHHSPTSAFDMSASMSAEGHHSQPPPSSPLYLAPPPTTHTHPGPPPHPPHGLFPYDTSDVNLGYPSSAPNDGNNSHNATPDVGHSAVANDTAGDGSTTAGPRLYDTGGVPSGLYDWSSGHEY